MNKFQFNSINHLFIAKDVLENLGYKVKIDRKEYTLSVKGDLNRIEKELNNYDLEYERRENL